MDVQKRKAPGAGQGTGGDGRDRTGQDTTNGTRITPDAAGADRKGLWSGDADAAVDVLRQWCPSGPWVLTSIVPDGRTSTETFRGTDAGVESMRRWIDARQGRENIYFTVNAVFGEVESKPNKGAISAVRAVHVDVDPRPGEPLDAERERAERLLRSYVPVPTVIVDSGGGLQGFWLLDEDTCPWAAQLG